MLEIVCLNCALHGATLVPELRKLLEGGIIRRGSACNPANRPAVSRQRLTEGFTLSDEDSPAMSDVVTIARLTHSLPEGLAALTAESEQAGWGFLRRLTDEWAVRLNRFSG